MTGEIFAGRYRLLEPLGRGAMSAVWLAHDDELERRVAMKMLAPSADRARFEREARAAAALSHPNICSLYDYGEADGRPYMVLEYLPNGSLEERLAGGALADDDTFRIATELAAGLAHAHERGLVHRDLKPANILFDAEGRAVIADFGIARMGNAGTLTEAGTVLGTASYISPEQAAGRPAGPASDVYSFGVILYRMLTGSLPFVSPNAMELVRMHRDDPPPAVTDARPDAPPQLASLVTAALAKDPAARPPDGAALQRELAAGAGATTLVVAGAVAQEAAQTRVLAPPTGRGGGGSRRLAGPLLALAALLLLAGLALAILLTRGGSGDGSPGTTAGEIKVTLVPTTSRTETGATAGQTTTARTTTAGTTTAETTTAPPTTTRPRPTTTAPLTTAAGGTTSPATTAPATTAPQTTTETTPTTTADVTTAPTTDGSTTATTTTTP